MRTKDALTILSSGENDGTIESPLRKYADDFLRQYEERENDILLKQAEAEVSLPFLESFKKKVLKTVSASVDNDLPVVTKFDLYSSIRKLSERSPTDRGLSKLAVNLEKVWHDEPVGTLSYGAVRGLVALYKDLFPKSKAADAIEAETSRLGLHKLPVTKLARIAKTINSQHDYDIAMEVNGYAGDRPEQVRSRALVRSLVELNGNEVSAGKTAKRDDRSIAERVGDRVSQLAKHADFNSALEEIESAKLTTSALMSQLNTAMMEMFDGGLENDGNRVQELLTSLEEFSSKLDEMAAAAGPHDSQTVPSEGGGWNEADDVGGMSNEELSDAAGMKKKWYDPRTWSLGKMSALIDQIVSTAEVLGPDFEKTAQEFIDNMTDILPPNPSEEHEELETPAEEKLEHELGVEVNPDMMDGEVQEHELQDGADLIDEITDVADEITQDAPPEAVDFIEHEKGEGHTAPVGTAEWGAEEILNEGHTAPPPSDEWLSEEMHEIETGEMPNASHAKISEKNFPLPKGKVKSQPKVTTYMKKLPSDGGKALKADVIEEALLDGKKVRYGSVTIHINNSNEVELWDKTAGRACGLADMDVAIADFIAMARRSARVAARAAKPQFIYDMKTHVFIPCEHCASVTEFEKAASKNDRYKCTCGATIPASITAQLENAGLDYKNYQLTIRYQPGSKIKSRVMEAISSITPHISELSDNGRGTLVLQVNVDGGDADLKMIEDKLMSMGGMAQLVDSREEAGGVSGESPEGMTPGSVPPGMQGGPGQAAEPNVEGFELEHSRSAQEMQQPAAPAQGQSVGLSDLDKKKLVEEQGRQWAGEGKSPEEILMGLRDIGAVDNVNDPFLQDQIRKMTMAASKSAQMAAPGIEAPPSAPAAEPPLDVPGQPAGVPESGSMTLDEVARASFTNSKAEGIPMIQAIANFSKALEKGDYDKALGRSPGQELSASDNDMLLSLVQEIWTSGNEPVGMETMPPPVEGGQLGSELPMVAASKKDAQAKMVIPKVRKPKDRVHVKGMDADSEGKDLLPTPKKINQQPNKQHGTMSKTDLGRDLEGKDLLPAPKGGKPKVTHDPKSQSGISLPKKKLDHDLGSEEPFKTPGLGSSPSVKK